MMWWASASLLPFLDLESELISSNSLFFTNLSRANITVETHSNSTRKLYWLLLLKRLLHTIITTLPMVIFFSCDYTFPPFLSESSRPEMFCKKGVLKNFTKFTEKHLCQSLLFNKVAGLRRLMFYPRAAMIWCFYLQLYRFIKKSSISLSNITKPSLK